MLKVIMSFTLMKYELFLSTDQHDKYYLYIVCGC